MKRRVITVFLLMMLIVAIYASQAFAVMKVLNVTRTPQQGEWWCWAAVDQSIMLCVPPERGVSPSQSWITSNFSPYPSGAGHIDYANACLRSTKLSSLNYNTSMQYNKLTWSGLQWQINNKGPMFARWTDGYGYPGGHAVTIRGYNTDTSVVYYMDPDGGGFYGVTYATFCSGVKNGYNWIWDGTIFDITPR